MAASISARYLWLQIHRLAFIPKYQSKISSLPKSCLKLSCRGFQPYSRTPKKFLKRITKDRFKENRDDVYFVDDQVLPLHSVIEAIETLKAYDLFGSEPIELLLKVNLGEGKNKVASLKGLVHFPTPVHQSQRVLVFAEGQDAIRAKDAGAYIVGGAELVKQVEAGEVEFDHCLSTLAFLPNIKHLPRILKNNMPNIRRGTATDNIEEALKLYSHGETYEADNTGILRHSVALTTFEDSAIEDNLYCMLKAVESHRKDEKGKFFEKVSLLIPPGPKLDLDLPRLLSSMESPVGNDEDEDVEQAGVLDPEVRESLRYAKHENKLETANVGTGKDEIKPKIEYLYVPKNCKRRSANNDLMVVHYTGWLAKSGRKFDSTIDVRRRYVPFEFVIGTGYVIRGWERGLLDMCPGEKRRITVPSILGYSKKGLRGMIPPNATLIFVIDLLDLRRAAPNYAPMDLFSSLDRNSDKILTRDEISHYVHYQSKSYRNKNAPKPTQEEHDKMVDDIMSKEDLNGDGIIQHSEFSGSKLHHNEL